MNQEDRLLLGALALLLNGEVLPAGTLPSPGDLVRDRLAMRMNGTLRLTPAGLQQLWQLRQAQAADDDLSQKSEAASIED